MKAKSLFKWGNKNILFVGLLSWWPNKDGFIWFYKKVFPFIKKVIPQVKFYVVGRGKKYFKKIVSQNEKNIVFTGYVKNTKPYLKKAGVFIIPLRMGSGIRIKALTAMARGIPVVSTKMGVKGLGVKNNKEVLVSDGPKTFAKAVIKILKNKKTALCLSKNAQQFIKKNYNEKLASRILNFYNR